MGRKLLLVVLLLAISLGGYFYFKPAPIVNLRPPGTEKKVLSEAEEYVANAVGCLPILPSHTSLPWLPLVVIGEKKVTKLEDTAHKAPLEFLELCLSRYKQDIEGYRLIFLKQERVQGKLKDTEKVLVHFREKPFSVHMDWLKGAVLAKKSLYVEGENGGKVKVRPNLPFVPFFVSVDVNGDQAKQTSRYGIDKFGMGFAINACVESMRAAKEANTLHLKYEGKVKPEEVGYRTCYKFVRKPYTPPEEDGVAEITLFIDAATLLQVGSVLRDVKGDLIAEYFFLDIEINPTFSADQFTDKAL